MHQLIRTKTKVRKALQRYAPTLFIFRAVTKKKLRIKNK